MIHLWVNDLRIAWNDTMLTAVLFLPFVCALALRLGLEPLREALRRWFDLYQHLPLVGAVFVEMTPLAVGMFGGLIMLDERDEGTLAALRVTPLPHSTYVGYRLLMPALLAILLTVAAWPLAGLALSWPLAAAAAALASLEAPVIALAMAGFAGNKIEGLALTRGLSILLFSSIAASMLPPAWQAACWWNPFYWPFKLFTAGAGGGSPASLLLIWAAGAACHAVYIRLLFARFRTRTGV